MPTFSGRAHLSHHETDAASLRRPSIAARPLGAYDLAESNGRPRQPALDVVRGVAIALVLAGHSGLGYAAVVGVTLFFVLSGYLITRLLVEEHERSGRTDLRAFYRRRVARLGPAVIAIVTVVGIAAVVAHLEATTVGALASLSYVTNWLIAFGVDLGYMAHTWSLAVEEQFYLAWPLTFALLWPRYGRGIIPMLAGLISLVVLLRFVVAPVGGAEYRTDLRADALLLGCLLALTAWCPGRLLAFGSVALLTVLVVRNWPADLAAVGYTMTAVGSVAVVGAASGASRPGPRPLAHLGRISYGAYLWHLPIFAVLGGGLAGVAVTLAIAEASFRWLEEPLRLRLRGRSGRRTATLEVSPAPA